MEKDWVKVFSSNISFESEIVKGMLLENEIEAVVVNRQDSSFVQMLPGMDEVYVHNSNEAKAKELIATSQEGKMENNL
ncbi:hypothetical protein GFS24_15840 [Chitinophaga sp. SYP-B3965]|jgi:hypothetical protein|uniref:putative signal transducing protein n=1 Tax=Chitinophaga sp. SYP-B3965 TaxID=2663120 RepID=UPI001299FDC3|nr:DUF2007 domain-containing protein [Chitinophaga sp. SYP-B3965]MRG46595.1 hypothetical protein [Chitinophaga sp. SYP-B3965]